MFNNNTNWAFQKNTSPSHQNPSIQNENIFQNWSAVWALVEQNGFWGPCFSQTKCVVFYVEPQSFYQMLQQCQASVFSMGSGSRSWTLLERSIFVCGTADWSVDPTKRGFNFLWTLWLGKMSWDWAGEHKGEVGTSIGTLKRG